MSKNTEEKRPLFAAAGDDSDLSDDDSRFQLTSLQEVDFHHQQHHPQQQKKSKHAHGHSHASGAHGHSHQQPKPHAHAHGHAHDGGNDHGHSHDDHGHGHAHDDHGHSHDEDEIITCTGKSQSRANLSNEVRIILMGVLMLLYSLGEVVFSLKAKSLTMFSDGLHNLSDAFALAIALWAERVQHRASSEGMSYGWKRAETIGGFVNSGFLVSMAIFVVLQAIPNFIEPEAVSKKEALYFVIVASIGIFLNLVGLAVFAGSGGHGHSHGGGSHGHSHGSGGRDHNIWALFLHFLGDVLTSTLVLGVGLLSMYYPADKHHWVQYADPVAAILSSIMIAVTAWPVLGPTTRIFLQFSPPGLDIPNIKQEIHRAIPVLDIHEVHFWQLVDGVIICTMHLKLPRDASWNNIRKSILDILHGHGVHNTTLQPEFVLDDTITAGLCVETGRCAPNCQAVRCCT
eukprot:m.144190 g.144190  ORF g.144190 m.144190 type:complete len:456 (+) comp16036_c1_seq1:341-1708(+)